MKIKSPFRKIVFIWALLRYCLFLRRIWSSELIKEPRGQVLVDFYPISPLLAIYAYFTNRLSQRYQGSIVTYKYNERVKNSLFLKKLYQSFNTTSFIHESPGAWRSNSNAAKAAHQLFHTLATKRDVKKLHYKDIPIGESVYSTYLRRTSGSTVDVKNDRLFEILAETIHLIEFWTGYCKNNTVHALISSHDAYIEYYVPMAVAHREKARVYLLKDETLEFKAWEGIRSRFAYLESMHETFHALDLEEQESGIKWSRDRLQKRLAGGNTDLFYAKTNLSAFSGVTEFTSYDNDEGRSKVLIATSSPSDNPLVYGGFLFDDFYEWLTFLGKLSERTNYTWYLKMHPWADEFYQNEISTILERFSKIEMLPLSTSFYTIFNMGVRFILTPYGTVGHELPLKGFTVINAGRNPHVSFDFNLTPGTVDEYERVILNLSDLRLSFEPESIYSFYYMQYNFIKNDELVFGSSRAMSEALGWNNRFSDQFFAWHRKHFDPNVHNYSIQTIDEFLSSDSSYIFRDGAVSLPDFIHPAIQKN